jgi:Domain of unknown function (DUF5667)
MKSFEKDILKYAEKTRLKAMERDAIRERVLSYMEYHPLSKKQLPIADSRRGEHRDFIYIPFNALSVRLASGFFALLVIIGVPFLAERAVPGDVLYLVKTGVNEGIRTQLASSPYEKVALETKLMERRISEARLLASEGKLTVEVEAQIAETVKVHAEAVQSGLAELRVDDADGAALAEIVFTSALEVQSAVLDQSEVASSTSVSSILSVVNTMRDEVASDANPATPSYDGVTARIELETTRAFELFESVKESATPEEIADIERRFTDIDRSIVAAKALREADETGAVTEMINVLGLIQKLISFLTDIDVRETVALETLVPLIMTPEERSDLIVKLMNEVMLMVPQIEDSRTRITDEGLAEKVTLGLAQVNTLMDDATRALDESRITEAEQKSGEANTLALDLMKLTLDTREVPATPVTPSQTSTSTEPLALPDAATTTPMTASTSIQSEIITPE